MGIVALGPCFESGLWAGSPRGEVLRALCNTADDSLGECFPSYEYCAFMAGVGRSTAAREIAMLRQLDILELVEQGGGRRRSNRYRVNVALLEICARRVRAARDEARRLSLPTDERIAMMAAARDACEKLLENRPAGGRFPEENRPAGDGNRPAHDIETVHGVDPNLQKNLKTEEPARERASPAGEKPGSALPAGRAPDDEPWRAADAEEALEETASREPLTDLERKVRTNHANTVLLWLIDGALEQFHRANLRLSLADMADGQTVERAVLAFDTPGARRAAQYARWALMWADGVPGTRDPRVLRAPSLRHVTHLAEALGPPGSARQARGRLSKLLAADAARRATGPPQADDRAARA